MWSGAAHSWNYELQNEKPILIANMLIVHYEDGRGVIVGGGQRTKLES